MAMPRKNPPSNIREIIEQYVAGEGGSTVILGRVIGVSDSTVRKWFEADESLKEAYEGAREAYMHKLYLELLQMSRSGKGNIAGLIFTLKAKFKQYDMPGSGKLVDVNVNTAPHVLLVKDHGSDEQWAALCAKQQKALLEGNVEPRSLPAQQPAQIESCEPVAAPAIPSPVHVPASAAAAPIAPAWAPPVWRGNG